MNVYLSGPIAGLTYAEGQSWRTYAINYLDKYGIEGISPLRGKEFLVKHGKLIGSYDENPLSRARGITTKDRWDTTRAHVCLVNVLGAERISIGTMIEIGWADYARVPIVMAMEPDGNPHEHPMVTGTVGFMTHDLDDALKIVVTLLVKDHTIRGV